MGFQKHSNLCKQHIYKTYKYDLNKGVIYKSKINEIVRLRLALTGFLLHLLLL